MHVTSTPTPLPLSAKLLLFRQKVDVTDRSWTWKLGVQGLNPPPPAHSLTDLE